MSETATDGGSTTLLFQQVLTLSSLLLCKGVHFDTAKPTFVFYKSGV